MRARDELAVVTDVPVRRGVLKQQPEELVPGKIQRLNRTDLQDDAQRFRTGLHHRNRLRMAIFRDEELLALMPGRSRHGRTHRHRLGCGSRLIEERRIGER